MMDPIIAKANKEQTRGSKMSTGQKRKSPSSRNSDGAGSSTTDPSASGGAVLSHRSLKHQPGAIAGDPIHHRRRCLQRGAKDKVYAERLAAGNCDLEANGDRSDAGGDDARIRGGGGGGSAGCSAMDGVVGTAKRSSIIASGGPPGNGEGNAARNFGQEMSNIEKPESTSSTQRSGGNSTSGNDNERNSSGFSSSKTSRKRGRSSGGRGDVVEKIISPPCWPFTDSSTVSKKPNLTSGNNATASAKAKKSQHCSSRPKTKSTSQGSRQPQPKYGPHQGEEGQDQLLGNGSASEITTGKYAEINSASSINGATIDGKMSKKNLKRNPNNSSSCQSEGKVKLQPASGIAPDWPCNRCTLLNSNRRKRCQVCGTPRYLTVGSDGILSLDEHHLCSGRANDDNSGANSITRGCSNSGTLSLLSSFGNATATSSLQHQLAVSVESQQSQLFAVIEAPVYTRSKRRKSLSQTRHQESQMCPEESGEMDQHSEELRYHESSELKQWIQKQRNEKRAKKRQCSRKLSLKTSVPEESAVMRVRLILAGEHVLPPCACRQGYPPTAAVNLDQQPIPPSRNDNPLIATFPTSVISRIIDCCPNDNHGSNVKKNGGMEQRQYGVDYATSGCNDNRVATKRNKDGKLDDDQASCKIIQDQSASNDDLGSAHAVAAAALLSQVQEKKSGSEEDVLQLKIAVGSLLQLQVTAAADEPAIQKQYPAQKSPSSQCNSVNDSYIPDESQSPSSTRNSATQGTQSFSDFIIKVVRVLIQGKPVLKKCLMAKIRSSSSSSLAKNTLFGESCSDVRANISSAALQLSQRTGIRCERNNWMTMSDDDDDFGEQKQESNGAVIFDDSTTAISSLIEPLLKEDVPGCDGNDAPLGRGNEEDTNTEKVHVANQPSAIVTSVADDGGNMSSDKDQTKQPIHVLAKEKRLGQSIDSEASSSACVQDDISKRIVQVAVAAVNSTLQMPGVTPNNQSAGAVNESNCNYDVRNQKLMVNEVNRFEDNDVGISGRCETRNVKIQSVLSSGKGAFEDNDNTNRNHAADNNITTPASSREEASFTQDESDAPGECSRPVHGVAEEAGIFPSAKGLEEFFAEEDSELMILTKENRCIAGTVGSQGTFCPISDSPFIPMTQQIPGFDYFSQASFGTPGSATFHDEHETTINNKFGVYLIEKSMAPARNDARIDGSLETIDKVTHLRGCLSSNVECLKDRTDDTKKMPAQQSTALVPYRRIADIADGTRNAERPVVGQIMSGGHRGVREHGGSAISCNVANSNNLPSTIQSADRNFAGINDQLNSLSPQGTMHDYISESTYLPDHDDDSNRTPDKSKAMAMTDGFQTGGSGKVITISEEQLVKAKKILDVSPQQQDIYMNCTTDQSLLEKKSDVFGARHTQHDSIEADGNDEFYPASSFPSFKMTKRKTMTDISKEIEATHQMLYRQTETSGRNRPSLNIPEEKQPIEQERMEQKYPPSSTRISLSKENLSNTANIVFGPVTKQSLGATLDSRATHATFSLRPMFQSTGKNVTESNMTFHRAGSFGVAAQAVSLEKTPSGFINDTNSLAKIPSAESTVVQGNCVDPIFLAGSMKGRSSARFEKPEQGMAKATCIFDSIDINDGMHRVDNWHPIAKSGVGMGSGGGQTFMLGFTKGGSNTKIDVSEENLTKAGRLLESTELSGFMPQAENAEYPSAKPGVVTKSELVLGSKGNGSYMTGFMKSSSNARIAISKKSTAKASRFVDFTEMNQSTSRIENAEHLSSRTGTCMEINSGQNFMNGFSRDGSNDMISIPEESVAKASCIFDSTDINDSMPRVESAQQANANSCAGPRIDGSQNLIGFMSDASNARIAISEKSIAKTSHIFDSPETNDDKPQAENAGHPSVKSGDGTRSNGGQKYMVGFTRGSSNTRIAVPKESMVKVSRLFASSDMNGGVPQAENAGDPSTMTDAGEGSNSFQNIKIGCMKGVSNTSTVIAEERMAKASRIVDPSRMSDGIPLCNKYELPSVKSLVDPVGNTGQNYMIDSTKGSSDTIAIEEKSMGKDSRIIDFTQINEGMLRAEDAGQPRGKSGAGPGSHGGKNYILGFTKGGSNARIEISDESMAKSKRVLDSMGMKSMPRVNNDEHPSTKSGFFPQTDGDHKYMLDLEKGVSSARIATSEESMTKADIIFDMKANGDSVPRFVREESHDAVKHDCISLGANQRVRFSVDSMQSRSSNEKNDGSSSDVTASVHEVTSDSPQCFSAPFTFVSSSRNIYSPEGCLAKAMKHDEQVLKKVSSDNYCDSALESGPWIAQVQHETFITPDTRLLKIGGACSQIKIHLKPVHRFSELDAGQSSAITKFETCLPGFKNMQVANVVTDKKGTPAKTVGALAHTGGVDCQTSMTTFSSSPCERNMHTPLHEMTNIAYDSSQSIMKSKRLFNEHPHITTKLASTNSISSSRQFAPYCPKYSKVTLRQFAAKHCANKVSSWTNCVEHGVKDVTMRVKSTNAIKLRFSKTDKSPLFFLGQRDAPKCSHIGKTTDINEWLCNQGCDDTLFTAKWIQNHYRWIVWKLAAMERCFPAQLGGQYLTYDRILSQIKGRYEKELRNAKRPAVRKILNRDCSAGVPIILCVSQILRFKTKLPQSSDQIVERNTEEIRLELTDGWYALSAVLDNILTNLVGQEKVQIGSKLMICNAQLLGSEDGADPLDDDYSSDRRNNPMLLKITANNSRLATWDAKLGFVNPKYTAPHMAIKVKSLSDIFPDGGAIPVIDLVICRRYPLLFLEKIMTVNGTQSIATNHLTEAEDAARQYKHDMNHQSAIEKYFDAAHRECSKEIDEDAPIHWKEMMSSNNPEEHYEKLGTTQQRVVGDWAQKRLLLLQRMVPKSIEDSLMDNSSFERTSVPYAKVLVKSFYYSKNITTCLDRLAKAQNMSAELTIWRVSEEHLHLLKEGAVIRIKNVSVKSNRDGILQLSAKPDQMEQLSREPECYQLIQSGYVPRSPKSLIRLNLISKKLDFSRLAREVDVVACVVRIQKQDDYTSEAWLTDESGFVMKLIRNHNSQSKDPFYLGNAETSLPTVVAYCNIQVTSFDTSQQCAVGLWNLSSCDGRHLMRFRCEELQTWCLTTVGMKHYRSVLDRINARIPTYAGPSSKYKVCIGYILGFNPSNTNSNPNALGMNVVVDYGEIFSLTACFPFHLLPIALQLSQDNSTAHGGAGIPSIIQGNLFDHANFFSTLHMLGEYFQNNQTLFSFSLEMAPCYGDQSPLLEVTDLYLVTIDALSRLHLSGGE